MHPELLNNPTFARYYETWQRDPKSLVFAPLAEFFCEHKLFADARRVCESGVKHNPNSVLAHFSLAKAYILTREWHSARHEAQWVLAKVPDHQGALDVLQKVEQSQAPVRHVVVQPAPLVAAIEAAGGSLVSAHDETDIVTGPAAKTPRTEAARGPVTEGPARDEVDSITGGTEWGPHFRQQTEPRAQIGHAGVEGDADKWGDSVTGPVMESVRGILAAAPAKKPLPWQTVTMAKIYAQQGHYFKARTIYKTILSRDPHNTEAKSGLAALEVAMSERMKKETQNV